MSKISSSTDPNHIHVARTTTDSPNLSIFAVLFLIGLCIPIQLMIGPTRLSAYRIVLLAAILPAIVNWMSVRDIKVCTTDILMLLLGITGAISLIAADGFANSIESSVIFFVETCGPYFIARSYIRTPEHFERFAKLLYYSVLFFLPFAIVENLTDRTLILDILGKVFPVWKNIWDFKRLGLERAQVVFEHPILFGVYCACAFCLCIHVYNYGKGFFRTVFTSSLAFLAAFASLSSGALTMMAAQLFLTFWDRLLKPVPMRWALFALMGVLAYVAVDLLSNRTPIQVFVHYLTFSSHNSYTRILIFENGIEALQLRPWFGYGLTNELVMKWSWLTTSIDNFFLLMAVRHGIPVFFVLLFALIFVFVRIGRVKITDERVCAYRAGLLICLGGLIVAGITVHYWNAVYCLFMFFMGAGMWVAEYSVPSDEETHRASNIQPGQYSAQHSQSAAARDPRERNLVTKPVNVRGRRERTKTPLTRARSK